MIARTRRIQNDYKIGRFLLHRSGVYFVYGRIVPKNQSVYRFARGRQRKLICKRRAYSRRDGFTR